MHALARIPANRHERVAVVLAVEKRLATQVAVHVGDFRVDGENALNSLAAVLGANASAARGGELLDVQRFTLGAEEPTV